MSAEQIGKLQGLLDRIKRNAGKPRVAGSAAAAPARAAAPAVVDQSVDDLLATPEPSPVPVEVDVQLDSIPPVEEAIPLVSTTRGQAAPLVDDSFSLDSEVSEVRVTTGPRELTGDVTVAAIEAEAEAVAAEELSEDDLIEVTEATSVPPAADVDIDFDDEDEQPPASSQRKVASSMDEALAAAAEQMDAEREVPLKTPPPESGPQAAPMPTGIAAPAAPDVDALLGQEVDIPTRAEAAGPTTEQLGQTIDLEEARGPALELAEQQAAPEMAAAPIEELEVALPGPQGVGKYDHNLQPPPGALDELDAHRRRREDDVPGAAPEIVAAGPEIVARPIPAGTPETFSGARESFRPNSFVELLDASLSLSGQ